MLTKIYGVSESSVPYYFLFFAAGNLIGPLLLGHLFDTIGRRKMISGTYLLSGALLLISALMLFYRYLLGAAVMIVGGLVALVLAVDAENKSLEDVALPLSLQGAALG